MSGKGGLVVAAIMLALLHIHMAKAKATNYVVGDLDGTGYYWSAKINPNYYPSGKTLRVGDTLQFIYNNNIHNVVGVGPNGYKNCDDSRGGKKYTTGNDKIALIPGWNYFICTKFAKNDNRNMCSNYKMKIAINAK